MRKNLLLVRYSSVYETHIWWPKPWESLLVRYSSIYDESHIWWPESWVYTDVVAFLSKPLKISWGLANSVTARLTCYSTAYLSTISRVFGTPASESKSYRTHKFSSCGCRSKYYHFPTKMNRSTTNQPPGTPPKNFEESGHWVVVLLAAYHRENCSICGVRLVQQCRKKIFCVRYVFWPAWPANSEHAKWFWERKMHDDSWALLCGSICSSILTLDASTSR